MGVILTYRVFPKEVEKIETLRDKIKQKINPEKIEIEPLAFGIKIVKFSKIVEDEEGEAEKIDKMLRSIEEVSEFEIIEVLKSF